MGQSVDENNIINTVFSSDSRYLKTIQQEKDEMLSEITQGIMVKNENVVLRMTDERGNTVVKKGFAQKNKDGKKRMDLNTYRTTGPQFIKTSAQILINQEKMKQIETRPSSDHVHLSSPSHIQSIKMQDQKPFTPFVFDKISYP